MKLRLWTSVFATLTMACTSFIEFPDKLPGDDSSTDIHDVIEVDSIDAGMDETECPIPGPILSDVRISDDSENSIRPAVVWTGSNFGVFWQDERVGNVAIYFAKISSSGIKIGSDIKLTDEINGTHSPSPVWTGSEFGLSWTDNTTREIYFARFSVDGDLVGSEIALTSDSTSSAPSLAWTGSEYGVCWCNLDSQLLLSIISSSGVAVVSDVLISDSAAYICQPSISWTGTATTVT